MSNLIFPKMLKLYNIIESVVTYIAPKFALLRIVKHFD